jgi:mono/diheme cytochrome c family protein
MKMTKKKKITWLCKTACIAACAALSFGQNSSGSKDYAELTKVPAKDSARANPMEHDSDALAAGGKLFGLHCAECHGVDAEGGKGKKKGPSLRAMEIQQATPGTLFWLLTNGSVRRGMPVWSKLPEPQRWQIVTYVKSLTPTSKPQTQNTPPASVGSATSPNHAAR